MGVAWWCGREVVWRLACFGAALTLWLGIKSAEELSHSPQWGLTVLTLVNRPMGRFTIDYRKCIGKSPPNFTVVLLGSCPPLPTAETGVLLPDTQWDKRMQIRNFSIVRQADGRGRGTLIKKKIKFSSYIKKFIMKQLQSQIWLTTS